MSGGVFVYVCIGTHCRWRAELKMKMKDTAAQLNILKSFAATALLGRVWPVAHGSYNDE